ncbi:prophage PhiRv2 protein [Mycobacterium tuberculosis XTB13-212]|nr:prophage PhiRv2 protein [Mycobacterium tuberculosis XTB13-212]
MCAFPSPSLGWTVSHETERPGMADAPPLSRRYITISEAAEYLAVTDRTVRQMIADGGLRGIPLRHPPRPSAPR